MIGMQYKITLPSDYDMNIIRTRVKENGYKTDGFEDLLFKCYLIKEKGVNSMENSYSPLYLWKSHTGMNKFIFDGYFDNIIKSFGWQQIHIGVPIMVELSDHFKEAKYVIECSTEVIKKETLTGFRDSLSEEAVPDQSYVGRVCIYNPELWRYSTNYFYKTCPNTEHELYQILHISQ